MSLGKFFMQWIYTAGQPELKIWHEKGTKNGMINIFIQQEQNSLFEFNLELLIKDNSGEKTEKIPVKDRVTKIVVASTNDVVLTPDPNVNLLFK